MNKPLDSAIALLYGELRIPVDQLLSKRELLSKFCQNLPIPLNELEPDTVAKRLLNLRKSGKLPRTRDLNNQQHTGALR